MTLFTFDDSIPAASNNPSDDQPLMLINNQSNASIWEENHIGFDTENGGTHTKLDFWNNIIPSLAVGEKGLVYPATRPASYTNSTGSGNSSMFFVNQDASTYPSPMTCIKAGGTFSGGTGARTFSSQFNCNGTPFGTAITGGYQYDISILSGVITNSNVIVFVSAQRSSLPNSSDIISWSYTNPNLTIYCENPSISISFLVIQV